MTTFFKDKHLALAIILSIGLIALRLVYVNFGPIDLAPDEAHYWEWSRHLDWSYYSKPPLVAWLMSASTALLGNTEVGVRLFSVIGISLLGLLAFLTIRTWRGDEKHNGAAWLALVTIHLTPIFGAGGVMMTPDVACTVMWALGLFLLSKINFETTDKAYWKYFIAIGVAIGLAGLAKYTAAAFYLLLGLYLIAGRNRRSWLLKPQVYVSGLISALTTLPVIYWNWKNDWVSFKHVAGQASGEATSNFDALGSVGEFLGSQFGVLGPITLLFVIAFWVTQRRSHSVGVMLWCFSAPLFALFIVKATGAKVQPNWAVLALYGGLIGAVGWAWTHKYSRYIFVAGLAFSTLITAIAHDTFIVRTIINKPIPIKNDPLKPVFGWQTLGDGISNILAELPSNTKLLTTRYQTASELAFYIKGNPQVLYLNPGYKRQNQYDYWPWPTGEDLSASPFLYINEGKNLPTEVANTFESCQPYGNIEAIRKGIKLREVNMFLCLEYKGNSRKLINKF